MATSTTILSEATMAANAVPSAGQVRRRRIDQETGRALVILGHAIEYLADEFAHDGGADRGRVDAIQFLMALNRTIYMACPEVPTVRQWLHLVLHGELKQREETADLGPGLGHSRI